MGVSPPLWLESPEIKLLSCRVVGRVEPHGYVVEVSIDGEERSIVVPEQAVEVKGDNFPTDGRLRVVVVAKLPGDKRLLTELPATPFTGSQRIKIDPGALQVA